MKYILYVIPAFLLLAGCNSSDNEPSAEPSSPDSVEKPAIPARIPLPPQEKPYTGQYCFIKNIYSRDGATYIEADYIQFLMGKEAVAAARKNNDAEMIVKENGDTTYATPDGTYIVNDKPDIKTLQLAANAEVYTIVSEDEIFIKKAGVDALKKAAGDFTIFVLTFNNRQEVVKIQQQYLP